MALVILVILLVVMLAVCGYLGYELFEVRGKMLDNDLKDVKEGYSTVDLTRNHGHWKIAPNGTVIRN